MKNLTFTRLLMEQQNGINTFHAKTRMKWREWLELNHKNEKSVWLIIYKKESEIPSIYYPDAVEEALCYGWIDSKPNKRNSESYYQFFSKRNPKSNWSKVNKDKIEKLLDKGLIAHAGLDSIAIAKQNGTWNALDSIENIEIPEDLKNQFNLNKTAQKYWEEFPRSSKRGILEWILNAKRPETRQKRIEDTISLAEKNIKANHFRQ